MGLAAFRKVDLVLAVVEPVHKCHLTVGRARMCVVS